MINRKVASKMIFLQLLATKMDSDRQQLAAVEQNIQDLVKKQTSLQKKDHQETITDVEEIELAGIDELLAEAKEDKNTTKSSSKLP